MNAKQIAAERAVDYIRDGMIVGLGTGSTAYYAIQKLGLRVQEGLEIKAIATSIQSEIQAQALGIPMITFADIDTIDITIDGADEVDASFQLIKGGGGALLREKIVAAASKELIVVVDERKLVPLLGHFPLPVEIVTFGHEMTLKKLQALGCHPVLRKADHKAFVTDNGHYIADCQFNEIPHPQKLHDQINSITGVVDNGLFVNMTKKVIVGTTNGEYRELENDLHTH